MRLYCINAINYLANCPKNVWAAEFVRLRMEFCRKYQNGLIFSTSHGTEFFKNVVDCLDGVEWSTKEYKGIYEDNFRKMIEMERKKCL